MYYTYNIKVNNNIILLIFLIPSITSLFAQKNVRLSLESITQIERDHPQEASDLRKVFLYNKYAKLLGKEHGIEVYASGPDYIFHFDGNQLEGIGQFQNSEYPHISISLTEDEKKMTFDAKTFTNEEDSFQIKVADDDYHSSTTIELSHFKNDKEIGYFLKQQLEGEIILEGYYMQLDSVYRDTVTTYDPDTYSETVVITNHSVMPVRCGKWKIKGDRGHVMAIYPPCRKD